MQLYGSLADNLHAAINSNIRLRGRKIYPETIQYWQDLLHHARRQLATSTARYASVEEKLADQLERVLRAHPASSMQTRDHLRAL